jgi:hypothetical protein
VPPLAPFLLGAAHTNGSRRQGRPHLRWIDSIKENTGFGLEKFKEIVKDKQMVQAGGGKD